MRMRKRRELKEGMVFEYKTIAKNKADSTPVTIQIAISSVMAKEPYNKWLFEFLGKHEFVPDEDGDDNFWCWCRQLSPEETKEYWETKNRKLPAIEFVVDDDDFEEIDE